MKPSLLNRRQFITRLQETPEWDIIVIGGGATGLGTALDAASRGYKTLLLEGADFAKGTSSRSTKLVHGGVRYLAQGNIRLVLDALRERGRLLKNAAHLVRRQSFVIPCYGMFSKLKYLAGLTLYDWLSGRYSFGKSRLLGRKETAEKLPSIRTQKLSGGVEYFDGQFDDARLTINLAQTIAEQGGTVINYCRVTGLLKEGGKVSGVAAFDTEAKQAYQLRAKAVVNATGIFVDDVLQMDSPGARPLVRPSQGAHVVVHGSSICNGSALMIPETSDGRVLFAIPWHNHLLVGTTDTPIDQHAQEPIPLKQEIDFILSTLRQYINDAPGKKDILSQFAGLRPLAASAGNQATKEISRDHKLVISPSGLITITGGKWTTYRKMAEETMDKAISVGALSPIPCKTKDLPLHGCTPEPVADHTSVHGRLIEDPLAVYGTDQTQVRQLIGKDASLGTRLVSALPYTEAEVVWAVRHEMARTVEDVLARRIRLLFLDARAAMQAAPRVAMLIAREEGYDESWQKEQVKSFLQLARNYLIADGEEKE
ncbi:MAG: glycerol-3-phosphate dehydrogenase/oxidase [Williamsia sp.]|nr:glycerol-3-phosphate dehydrogenase/oxidase [Williamsia sp.]